jgi:hypothetical protein
MRSKHQRDSANQSDAMRANECCDSNEQRQRDDITDSIRVIVGDSLRQQECWHEQREEQWL